MRTQPDKLTKVPDSDLFLPGEAEWTYEVTHFKRTRLNGLAKDEDTGVASKVQAILDHRFRLLEVSTDGDLEPFWAMLDLYEDCKMILQNFPPFKPTGPLDGIMQATVSDMDQTLGYLHRAKQKGILRLDLTGPSMPPELEKPRLRVG